MSEDPKLFDAGDYNLFRYCHNDPIDSVDPMGLEQNWAQTGAPISGNHVAQAIELGKEMAKQITHQIAQLQAHVDAMGYPGHGAIAIGGANYQIGQLQNALGNVMNALGLTSGQGSKANQSNLGAVRRTIPTGVRVEKNENGSSTVVIPWTLQLLDKQNKATFGEGIRVDERIEHSNPVAFAPTGEITGGFWTQPYGVAYDPWTLPFRAPNGQVTTMQTISVGDREATWNATVHADGAVEAQYWAPFH
jgi:hypothetical protein